MALKHLLPGRLGFGTAPLGNMFRDIPADEARATVEAAWDHGVRYYDTAPFYGAGLAEERLGEVLAGKPRDAFVLSTKVGRVILDEHETDVPDFGEKGGLFEHGNPNKILHEWTADATERSIEGSLKRLGTDRLDIVWVHDIAQDFHGDAWLARFEEARTGAFRVLSRLRDEGVIKAWGLGVNKTEPIELALALDEPRPDGFLLAGRYTLLDHEHALTRLLPMAQEQNVDMVVGGPYSSGVLAGGTHFEYQQAPAEIIERVGRLKALTAKHGVGIKAAALQFSLAHPASAAVVAGATRPGRLSEDTAALNETIPAAFWTDLRAEGLVGAAAPLPHHA
ncbi:MULTISPECIES: aldo/keto reductase [unclassified Streptomyces]|uniref:aldo/keto reductase n=1 Tax=unclassified Streptomyces TaxID=2593676 RepID=UPI000DB93BE9|nr:MULTISPECIES: aldo/keto reductase [unclassified Streptomyces]MYT75403.1 aldo/keto reductase [Streptomyces sp. SID8367]RAJ86805.1 D-threo-aldose 1-dehydrogenase [Streptomyces sp. PsTaAH-137]